VNRIGFVLKVRAERLEAYKAHHQEVWPEMRAALSASGWHNYSLFIRADGLLFGYLETPESLAVARAKMAATEVNARWQALMAPFFELPEGAKPDELMVELEPIFHLP
jgi:L-rhamnose mutarotase